MSGPRDYNECAVCFGLYEDDIADGQLTQEWIQCTEAGCRKWMHISCLDTDGDMFICNVCKNAFCKNAIGKINV